jgi:hypothetical protein
LAHSDILRLIAEIAVALTGFTGIVAVLGRRARGDWSPEEMLSLRVLIETSLTALFLSFIPDLLNMVVDSESTVWRVSNGLLGITHLATFGAFLLRAKLANPTSSQVMLGVTAISLILAHFLVAAGLFTTWAALIFIIGLLQQLFIAIHNFVILLFPLDATDSESPGEAEE